MLSTELSAATKNFLNKMMMSDIIKINGHYHPFITKLEVHPTVGQKIEDHTLVIETDFHIYNWWEIREDCRQLNDHEWHIGDDVISFGVVQAL